MIRPDVLVAWPRHIDYPLFRYSLERFKPYFNEVHIALTDMNQVENYSHFIINNVDAHFKEIPPTSKDWRDVAVNTLLEKSSAEFVLFLEQDFLIRDERFFEVLLNVSEYSFIFYQEDERIHPACALVPRFAIDKTAKDFAARPPAFDHFGLFFNEVLRQISGADLDTIGLRNGIDYCHLAGLTQNYHAKPFHHPNQFLTYNHYAQKLPVPYNEFKLRMEQIDKQEAFEESEADEVVKEFFPKEGGE